MSQVNKGAGQALQHVWNGSDWVPASGASGGASSVSVTANALDAGPACGQAVIAVTGTAVQLPANVLVNGVIVSAKPSNTHNILIGGVGVTNTEDGTGNGAILPPGGSISFAVANTNALFINGTAGDIISFAGS